MNVEQARERMAVCMAALIEGGQFYGYLLQHMEMRHEPGLPAGLAVRFAQEEGRLVLSFNPAWWVQPKSLPWIKGVTPEEPWSDLNLQEGLKHECHHVILRHLTRCGSRQAQWWNIAADMSINQHLQDLPRGIVTLDFEGRTYPKDLSADSYYDLLVRFSPPCPTHGHRKPGPDKADGSPGEQDLPCPHCSGQTFDCHAGWLSGSDPEAEEAARNAVERAYQRYEDAKDHAKGRGTLPSHLERAIEEHRHRPYDWRRKLRSIGQSSIHHGRRPTRLRPNRRYGVLFPGRKPQRTGKVVLGIDTSGSVTQAMLSAFWTEARAMACKVEVVVVECDAGIHAVWRLRGSRTTKLHGGGGSDFKQVFDLVLGRSVGNPKWSALAKGAGQLVFLTDGDISVPASNETGLPVYWAVPKGCKAPTKEYGEEIPLSIEA